MALARIPLVLLTLALISTSAYAVTTSSQQPNDILASPSSRATSASEGLESLSIVADGDATAIGGKDRVDDSDASEHTQPRLPESFPDHAPDMRPSESIISDASVSISATVTQKNSPAIITYNVTAGSLTIDETDYEITSGSGIFNQQSLLVTLHVTVSIDDWTGRLVLNGHADHALSEPGSVSIDFDAPQSKLASKFFVELTGTLTLN